MFELGRDFFLGLARAPHPGSFALQGYFALLADLGYAPHLELGAGAEPVAAEGARGAAYYLNVEEGTLRTARHPGTRDFPLSPEAVGALRRIMAAPEARGEEEPPVVGQRVGPMLVRLALRLFETHLERPLHSARFLEEMVLRQI
jgi:hypothetical protein